MDKILLRGARTHNLKNIDLEIPRDQLIVITGLSGSGKSSLAFDTLYAEGQRRYVESLSTYARQFLSMMEKPEIDHIEGLSPAISIEQKSTSHNPRSTIGTITEIYDYLRLLFARVGEPRCPQHDLPLAAQTVSQMVDEVLAQEEGSRLMILAPVVRERKGEHSTLFDDLQRQGFLRVRIDGRLHELDDLPKLDKKKKHSIDVVIDRFKIKPDIGLRLAESFDICLALSEGLAVVTPLDETRAGDPKNTLMFSSRFSCPVCGYSITELEPRIFSFNNPSGACPDCDGLGIKQFFDAEKIVQDPGLNLAAGAVKGWDRRSVYYYQMLESVARHYQVDISLPFGELPKTFTDVVLRGSGLEKIKFEYINSRGDSMHRLHSFEGVLPNLERRYRETDSSSVREELSRLLTNRPCTSCGGSRLNEAARHVFIGKTRLPDVTSMSIEEADAYFQSLELSGQKAEIADKVCREINLRLKFLINVGLEYLTLDRKAETLSGGEAQRIRLASQIGAGLVGVMYILDEPSIGLHQRDNDRLLETLNHLKNLGNTLIVVEHDEDAILAADHVIDIGPGAGVHGGEIVAQGSPEEITGNANSITGDYLAGRRQIVIPEKRSAPVPGKSLVLKGASGNNLNKVDVSIPTGLFTCVTGVSGSGKSTLVNATLYPILAEKLNGATTLDSSPYRSIEGLELFDKVIDIDQSPIGRTPRSNPATYTGVFTAVRELFAGTKEARSRGYKAGRFSFNVKGGRCEACQGDGVIKVEMHFLPDIYVPCDECKGKRYNRETLDITYKDKNIHEVLELTVEDALEFFSAIPAISRKLKTLCDVGLTYLTLGQNAVTLSGGEAQRVKLAKELSKKSTGKTFYILDEPTTGLHFYDIQQLINVLDALKAQGNTILVIEHNLDVIKTADWIIDLGPEGGSKGGKIIACGTPEDVAKNANSYTGKYLAKILKKAER